MPVSKTDHLQVSAFLENLQDIEVVREALKGLEIKKNDIIKGGVKDAIEFFSRKKSPKYLIIDVSNSDMPVSDLSRLADLCDPEVNVIAIGTRNDVGLYRDLMKLGISDYLVSPLFPDILARSLKIFFFGEDSTKKAQSKFGKMIAFVGTRGGVGTSFLATNFAALIAREKSRRVVLVDLDLHFGTDSLYFDLKSNTGLKDALENPNRIDPVFIERLLTPVDDRLSIVESEESLEEQINYKAEGVEILLKNLSKQFHYIVIDVPHYCNSTIQAVISHTHIMTLITDASLAGLRDAGRIIQLFGVEEGGRKIVLVMNKSGLYEKGEVKVEDFESTLSRKIDHILPFDKNAPMDFINRGKILVEEKTPLADSIRDLVDDVIGAKKPEEKLSWLSKILRKIK